MSASLKKSSPLNLLFILLIACGFQLQSCQNAGGSASGKSAATAITDAEYHYLVEEYSKKGGGSLEKGLKKSQIFNNESTLKFKDEDADYKFTAFRISGDDGQTKGVLIRFDIDRIFTPLSGSPKRDQQVKYLCVPSAASASTLHQHYVKQIRKMDYIDNEVFLSNLSKLLAEVYM